MLHRRRRNQRSTNQRIHQKTDIHKLVGKQRGVFVREYCARLHRPGCRIDLVIKRNQSPRRKLFQRGPIKRVRRKLRAFLQPRLQRFQVILCNRKDHRDRLNLGDDRQDHAPVCLNYIAGIDQP